MVQEWSSCPQSPTGPVLPWFPLVNFPASSGALPDRLSRVGRDLPQAQGAGLEKGRSLQVFFLSNHSHLQSSYLGYIVTTLGKTFTTQVPFCRLMRDFKKVIWSICSEVDMCLE